jgi:hypothetical protein
LISAAGKIGCVHSRHVPADPAAENLRIGIVVLGRRSHFNRIGDGSIDGLGFVIDHDKNCITGQADNRARCSTLKRERCADGSPADPRRALEHIARLTR